MRKVRVINRTRDIILAEQAEMADSFLRRGWGLLGHSTLVPGGGMVITRTNCIHSMFMRFIFDALYLDRHGRVVQTLPHFKPFKVGPMLWQADLVVELPSGTILATGTETGDLVSLES